MDGVSSARFGNFCLAWSWWPHPKHMTVSAVKYHLLQAGIYFAMWLLMLCPMSPPPLLARARPTSTGAVPDQVRRP